jgi:hypothetical protein
MVALRWFGIVGGERDTCFRRGLDIFFFCLAIVFCVARENAFFVAELARFAPGAKL